MTDETGPSAGETDAPARLLAAGSLRLDVADARLWVAGEPARLGAKALALLQALMERPQTLVVVSRRACTSRSESSWKSSTKLFPTCDHITSMRARSLNTY